jgi:hypothetical protein
MNKRLQAPSLTSRIGPVALGLLLGAITAFLLAWLCGTPLPF